MNWFYSVWAPTLTSLITLVSGHGANASSVPWRWALRLAQIPALALLEPLHLLAFHGFAHLNLTIFIELTGGWEKW